MFRGVYGHHSGALPWIDSDESTLPGLQKLVGAEEGEVASMNGLTVNLHILLTSFYTPSSRRHKILLENQAFPSDHYAIESQIRLKGFDPKESMVCLKPREVSSYSNIFYTVMFREKMYLELKTSLITSTNMEMRSLSFCSVESNIIQDNSLTSKPSPRLVRTR